jgi:phosphoenolpyruvate-protein phosphotransferase
MKTVKSGTNDKVNKKYYGTIASRGLTKGPVSIFKKENYSFTRTDGNNPQVESKKLVNAITGSIEEIRIIKDKIISEHIESEAQVFEAHILILQDPALIEKANSEIYLGVNSEAAWMAAIDYYAKLISALPNPTLSARADDVRDVGDRVLKHLLGGKNNYEVRLYQSSILLAYDLVPSQTAALDRSLVLGFCTAKGGPTSHTAILAKALGIPAIVGLGDEIMEITSGTQLIMDAELGEIIVNPNKNTLLEFQNRFINYSNQSINELSQANNPAMTDDGVTVEIVANIGSAENAISAISYGAEGVGLLRTEFLFLDRDHAPSEEEQINQYSRILEINDKKPVTARTLDIGGDKDVPYIGFKQESNPYLGWRGIRISLDEPVIFKTQLRALVKASYGHNLRIMFPMISTIHEFREAKKIFMGVRKEIEAESNFIIPKIQLGIMVEVPSVVILADQFAKEVDFFSIGTNDLTQYTMAADRGNNLVSNLGDPCNPAILRQIKHVIEVSHLAGKWVGLCGELGSDPEGIPILLGLGLDEFSITPSAIPHTKAIIRRWTLKDAQRIAEASMGAESASEVRTIVSSASKH